MITILDYGAGNLRSVQNTLGEIGAQYELVRDAAGLERAPKIILPGVGHFGQMLRALDEMNVRQALIARIKANVPFLGICLGLQGLFESSAEAPGQPGLGIFPGAVERFQIDARVPHMGWNQLDLVRPSRLLKGLPERPRVYFAHSYYVPVVAQTPPPAPTRSPTPPSSNPATRSACNVILKNPAHSASPSCATSWSWF